MSNAFDGPLMISGGEGGGLRRSRDEKEGKTGRKEARETGSLLARVRRMNRRTSRTHQNPCGEGPVPEQDTLFGGTACVRCLRVRRRKLLFTPHENTQLCGRRDDGKPT